jgi:contractile injection system tube protein/LysM domain-containing protein
MERVAFLVEATGERIDCMLNPETVVLKRSAGVQRRKSFSGQLTGVDLSDDPLLFTGGGLTELELDLMFDLGLDPQSPHQSVRRLTERFWQLAENTTADTGYGSPPLVRFIWGKEWNLLGVVTAVAERFERFTPSGEPRRSWLRMRFVRVPDSQPVLATNSVSTSEAGTSDEAESLADLLPPTVPPEIAETAQLQATHTVIGGGTTGETLPQIAYAYYGNKDLWRLLAWFNNIEDPTQLEAGMTLQIPPRTVLERLHQ